MPNIKELNSQLALLRHHWKVIPADCFEEETRRECQENILLVQREAEEFRQAFRTAFLMTKATAVAMEVDGMQIVKAQTVFNWEPLRDRFLKMVDLKEQQRIEHYQNEIKKTYEPEQQPSNEQPEQRAIPSANSQAKV